MCCNDSFKKNLTNVKQKINRFFLIILMELNRTYDTFRLPRPQKNYKPRSLAYYANASRHQGKLWKLFYYDEFSRNAHFITTSSLKLGKLFEKSQVHKITKTIISENSIVNYQKKVHNKRNFHTFRVIFWMPDLKF